MPCPPRPSGNMPVVQGPPRRSTSAARSMARKRTVMELGPTAPRSRALIWSGPPSLAVTRPMPGASTTCTAMSRSGVRTCMTHQAPPAWAAAAPGSSAPPTAVPPTAAGPTRAAAATSWASAPPQFQPRRGALLPVESGREGRPTGARRASLAPRRNHFSQSCPFNSSSCPCCHPLNSLRS